MLSKLKSPVIWQINFVHLLIWNTENTVYLLWCSGQKCIINSNREETSDKSKQKTVYNIIDLYSSKCQCPNRERFEELFQIWRNIAIKYNTWNWIESWTKRKKKCFCYNGNWLYLIPIWSLGEITVSSRSNSGITSPIKFVLTHATLTSLWLRQ